jgi:uncharacterized protein
MENSPRIMTASGEFFYFLEPARYTYKVEHLAESASKICRWNGNCKPFYSVLQHCHLVSLHVPQQHALAAMVHDLIEPLVGDCVSPLKALLPTLKQIEIDAEGQMCKQLGIGFPFDKSIKLADIRSQHTEKRDLFSVGTWDMDFNNVWPPEYSPFEETIVPVSPKEAFDMFMTRYVELTEKK